MTKLKPHRIFNPYSNCFICKTIKLIGKDIYLTRHPDLISPDDSSSVIQPIYFDESLTYLEEDIEKYDELTNYNQILFNDDENDPDYEELERIENLVKLLNLDFERSEVASVLKNLNLTESKFKITFYRNRTAELKHLFKTSAIDKKLGYLTYIDSKLLK